MCTGIFNLLWFIVYGWWNGLILLLLSVLFAVTIVGIPIAKALFQLAKLIAFPFGKTIVRETELKGSENVSEVRRIGGIIANIIWFPIGLALAVYFLFSGITLFISIIGIPEGIVCCRIAKFVIMPIGAKVISTN